MSDLDPVNDWDKYHAHVYFDEATADQAEALCVALWRACHVGLGRMHRKPVGPHPRWSCQVSFDAKDFDDVVAHLRANREALSVLVHPLMGDALEEHSTHARWLGDPVELKLDLFRSS